MSTSKTEERLEALERRMDELERRQRETAVVMVAGAALLQGRIEEIERQQAETQTILVAGAAVLVMGARAFASELGSPADAAAFDGVLESLGARLSEPSARVDGYDDLLDAIRAHLPRRRGLRLVSEEESVDVRE